MAFESAEYRSHLKPIWCPGCGAYGVLNAMQRAFVQLQIPPWNIAVISGIGCSSRLPGYLNTYSFNAVHGRALPIASGVKISRPEITVVSVGGDGDGFAIGGNHFPHAARRNVDLTYIVLDNSIYGLTKGQLSPTSELDVQTVTSPYGNIENPVRPLMLALAGQASFVAQGFSGDIKHLTGLLVQGIEHRGFAFVLVKTPCITYLGKSQFEFIRQRVRYLGDDHDPSDRAMAFQVAEDEGSTPAGVIFRESRPTFRERVGAIQKKAVPAGGGLPYQVEDLLDSFLPE